MSEEHPTAGGDPGEQRRAADTPAAKGFFRRNRQLLQHWLVFVGVLAIMVAIDQWAVGWINSTLSEVTADATAWLLRLFGMRSQTLGVAVWTPICFLRIIGECTAYYPSSIFLAAILAFPARWSSKLLGLLIGLPLILVINQLRLVSLCYIQYWIPQYFDTMHMVVWQSLIIVVTVLLWLVWATTLARGDEPPSA